MNTLGCGANLRDQLCEIGFEQIQRFANRAERCRLN
jgi:hypothetical protein